MCPTPSHTAAQPGQCIHPLLQKVGNVPGCARSRCLCRTIRARQSASCLGCCASRIAGMQHVSRRDRTYIVRTCCDDGRRRWPAFASRLSGQTHSTSPRLVRRRSRPTPPLPSPPPPRWDLCRWKSMSHQNNKKPKQAGQSRRCAICRLKRAAVAACIWWQPPSPKHLTAPDGNQVEHLALAKQQQRAHPSVVCRPKLR